MTENVDEIQNSEKSNNMIVDANSDSMNLFYKKNTLTLIYYSFQMATNPWLVESVNFFLYLKCPECVFETKYENEVKFQCHALKNHPLSNVLFDNMVSVSGLNANKNEVLGLIKKESHDNYEEYNESHNGESVHEKSFPSPISELKVELFEEENNFFVQESTVCFIILYPP